MSFDVNPELKIPDLFYDVYARILPGICSVVVIKYFIIVDSTPLTAIDLIVIAFIGFIFGLCTNPIASRITGLIENFFIKKNNKPANFIAELLIKCNYTSRFSMIIDKMHGEITFFAQMVIHLLLITVVASIYGKTLIHSRLMMIIILLVMYCLLCCFEVADRRMKRIIRQDECLKSSLNDI